MTHQKTLVKIQKVIESDVSDWEKIISIRKISVLAYEEEVKHSGITLEEIKKQIVEHSGYTIEQINKKTRDQYIIEARQLAHYKARRDTPFSLSNIGFYFGGKDHATVLHSCRKVEDYLKTDKRYRARNESFLTK